MVFAKPDSRYSQKAFAVLNQAAKDAGGYCLLCRRK